MGDWKETLFVWKGKLEGVPHNGGSLYSPQESVVYVDDSLKCEDTKGPREALLIDWETKMSFAGSWLGSQSSSDEDSPLHASSLLSPNPDDNLNAFKLNAKLQTQSDSFLVFDMKGNYKLDNGGGHESYKDKRHTLVIGRKVVFGSGLDLGGWLAEGPNFMLAAARGTTEFGPFVSLGFVAVSSVGIEPTLTLCRRYTEEDDARSDSSVSDEDFLCNMLKKMHSDDLCDKYIGGVVKQATFGGSIEKHLPLAGEKGGRVPKDFLESNPDMIHPNDKQIGLNRRPVEEGREKKRSRKS